ncbi:MAG: hypothetical protein GXP49_06375 [Deltaproteobacteria bacterium]|nr:hypothetical protein [Deltaproteobacteria bacterium]
MKKVRVWLELVAVLSFAVFLTGGLCEDLGQVTFTIDQETDEITIDLDQALADAVNAGLIEGWDQLPAQQCIKMKNGLVVYPDAMDIDLQNNSKEGPTVMKYRGHIKSIQINELKYTVTENSATIDIPGVDLFVGDFGADKDALQWVASAPEVKAGDTGDYPIQVTNDLQNILGGIIKNDMKFSYTFKVTYKGDICKGQQLGSLTLKAKMVVEVTAEAI